MRPTQTGPTNAQAQRAEAMRQDAAQARREQAIAAGNKELADANAKHPPREIGRYSAGGENSPQAQVERTWKIPGK